MSHTIEIFSGNCYFCKRTINIIEAGKCYGCKLIVYDLSNVNEEIIKKIREYKINSVPTIIIDGKIKIIGLPNFAWTCDDKFYNYLEIAKKIKEFISKKYDENAKVIVFGSVPKGTYTPLSDLDILIVSDKIKEYAKTVVEIKEYLNDFFAPIEFHFATDEVFNRWYKKFLDYYVEV